jgi:hypothetical protein
VKNHDAILHFAVRVAHGRSQGRVVQAQFRKSLAGAEMKIAKDEITLLGLRRGWRLCMRKRDTEQGQETMHVFVA